MNALFVSYNLFCIDKKDGGRQVSSRNRECFRTCVDGDLYTFFIYFSEKNGITLQGNEIALQGAKNKVFSLFNYLKGYDMITPQIEKHIVNFVNSKSIDIVFFDSSIFGRTIRKIKKETKARTICYMHNVEAYYAL